MAFRNTAFIKNDAITHQGRSVRGRFYGGERRYGVFAMLPEGGEIRSKVAKNMTWEPLMLLGRSKEKYLIKIL